MTVVQKPKADTRVVAVVALVIAALEVLANAGIYVLQVVLQVRGGASVVGVAWLSLLGLPMALVVLILGIVAWTRGDRGRLLGAAATGIGCAILVPALIGLLENAILSIG